MLFKQQMYQGSLREKILIIMLYEKNGLRVILLMAADMMQKCGTSSMQEIWRHIDLSLFEPLESFVPFGIGPLLFDEAYFESDPYGLGQPGLGMPMIACPAGRDLLFIGWRFAVTLLRKYYFNLLFEAGSASFRFRFRFFSGSFDVSIDE
jgi:hypothetical protein